MLTESKLEAQAKRMVASYFSTHSQPVLTHVLISKMISKTNGYQAPAEAQFRDAIVAMLSTNRIKLNRFYFSDIFGEFVSLLSISLRCIIHSLEPCVVCMSERLLRGSGKSNFKQLFTPGPT